MLQLLTLLLGFSFFFYVKNINTRAWLFFNFNYVIFSKFFFFVVVDKVTENTEKFINNPSYA